MMINSPFDTNYLNSKSLKGWTAALDVVVLATWGVGEIDNEYYNAIVKMIESITWIEIHLNRQNQICSFSSVTWTNFALESNKNTPNPKVRAAEGA